MSSLSHACRSDKRPLSHLLVDTRIRVGTNVSLVSVRFSFQRLMTSSQVPPPLSRQCKSSDLRSISNFILFVIGRTGRIRTGPWESVDRSVITSSAQCIRFSTLSRPTPHSIVSYTNEFTTLVESHGCRTRGGNSVKNHHQVIFTCLSSNSNVLSLGVWDTTHLVFYQCCIWYSMCLAL